MKFTDGFWRIKEGVNIKNPKEIYQTKKEDNSLIVYAPERYIKKRSNTLNCTLFTVNFSSPMPGVIRVRAYHFKGGQGKGPEFEIKEDKCPGLNIKENENRINLQTGNLKAKIDKKDWQVEFINQKGKITSSDFGNLGYIINEDNSTFMREQLSLGVGEYVYGLGERFTQFVKNGQVVDIWNRDGGTNTEQAYKNVPFYITNKGYGVLVNHPEKVSFEVASERVSKVQFSVPGEYIDYYIINGPSLKQVLEKYTDLTGRPSLPPAWSFGLWLTTSFTTRYDEETVNNFVNGMKDRDIPLDVFHFDCFWMRDFHWCNFKWDDRVFPDPEGMIKRLKEKGLKICVWINPYIAQQSSLFEEGQKKGYLLKTPDGDVWQTDGWQAGMGIVDFTNPEACDWYADKLKELLDMGVDTFKTDFGERIPTEVKYYDGSDPEKMHNYYSYLYNKVVYKTLAEEVGKEEAVLFARSGTTGSQKFPVHWGGDCITSYESMAESLRGGLSLSMSGFGFWSHDIGGFTGDKDPDIFKRWVAFGLLSSHSRLHGSDSYRVPWKYDEEAVEVTRFFAKLKCKLMPYIYKNAKIASEKGIPMMRSMVLEFPDDPACSRLERQYMLGDSLLVAPVLSQKGKVDYYIPSGKWTNFITNEVYQGPKWVKETHGYKSIPLMVRPNSIIPVGNNGNKAEYDYTEDVSLHLFELDKGKSSAINIYNPEKDNKLVVEITRNSEEIIIKVKEGDSGSFTILLRNIYEISSIQSGEIEKRETGIKINPVSDTKIIRVKL